MKTLGDWVPAFAGTTNAMARKLPGEGYPREWPPDVVMSDEVKALVDRRWAEYGL